MEDTTFGGPPNGLVFCSKKPTPPNPSTWITDADTCKNMCKNPDGTQRYMIFWNAMSARFARLASGNVVVILNAKRKRAANSAANPPVCAECVNPDSIFSKDEEPNLQWGKIWKVDVILVTDLPESTGLLQPTTCANDQSLNNLKAKLAARTDPVSGYSTPVDYFCTEARQADVEGILRARSQRYVMAADRKCGIQSYKP